MRTHLSSSIIISFHCRKKNKELETLWESERKYQERKQTSKIKVVVDKDGERRNGESSSITSKPTKIKLKKSTELRRKTSSPRLKIIPKDISFFR